MKTLTLTIAALSALTLNAFAGASSGGGLFAPESAVHCIYQDGRGHEVKVEIQGEPSTGEYRAEATEATLNGLFAPVDFDNVVREKISETKAKYSAPGLVLVLDLTSDRRTLPPVNAATMRAKGINGGKRVNLSCMLDY